MGKKHKHASIIVEWANGADIEYFSVDKKQWLPSYSPSWHPHVNYRVAHKNTPDIVEEVHFYHDGSFMHFGYRENDQKNLRLIFDGETYILKSAELL